ncbi:MAG: PAC2 family protein [Candidatus Brockarchaeota archaeon]|nr:PAC2 family protein [Candidatus Brockarchaeota archaeon]
MSSDLRLRAAPKLAKGSLVIGLSGWGDAGNASTICVTYLVEKLRAKEIGEITSGRFYDYQIRRPHVRIERGLVKEYVPPRNKLFFLKVGANQGVLILRGTEPNVDWPGYAQAVLEAAERTKVKRVFMIGSYVGGVPHTVEPVLSATTKSESFLEEMVGLGFEPSNYEGPTGVYSEILELCDERGVDAVSLWGAVPPYIQGEDPKLAFHILKKISPLLGVNVPLQELEKKGEDLDRQIAEEAKLNPELRRLISSLELEYRTLHRFPSYTV